MSEANINAFSELWSESSNGSLDGDGFAPARQTGSVRTRQSPFEQCYEEYFGRLVEGLHQLHGPHGFDAEDVAHRAFEKLAQKLAETEIHNPEAFVWRVAQNLALSIRRSQAVRQRHADETIAAAATREPNTLTPERAALAREELARVNAALQAMDERRRLIFLLRRIEGLNYTQIAERLGISRPAVAKHLTKAVAEIDAFLSES